MKNIKTYEDFNTIFTITDYLKINHVDTSNTIFSFLDNGIESLEGIERFKNLKELYCNQNKIISLYPIENSTKLEILDCSQNKITSLDGIENLTNLTFLSFSYNQITSLKLIENLTKIEELYCRHNPIDWVDYIDKDGRTYYTKLHKSIKSFRSDKFPSIGLYWKFMDENQPSGISRKFNF